MAQGLIGRNVRDDFSKQAIAEIAKGVGYRCSNPECDRPTVGANAAQDGIITIGVAAHICAASPGGPRFNAAQATGVRRSAGNGIWLCQNCGRLIDADAEKFTVEVLAEWKRLAQRRAFRDLVAPKGSASSDEVARIGPIVAKDNAVDPESAALFSRVRTAATSDLEAYRQGAIWSSKPVELTLRLYDDSETPPFNIAKLPLAIEIAPEVTIVSPPGTGKTTTLLQFAAQVLSANSIVPLYFRLGDWSAGSSGLLASLRQRPAFKGLSEDDLHALAQRGRILLLLDGWNELDSVARKRLRIELDEVRRNWPFVRLVATTRRQILDVPLSGPRVLIEPLSYEQQIEIARAQSGALGVKTVDDAWRTPGVRELIAIPLYLSALLSGATQDHAASTKEELLRLFVEQHERASDHAEVLHATLFGCHNEVLTALASKLNASDSTAMTETEARQIIAATAARLRELGQIVGQLEPSTVLEVLTSHHALTRSETGSGTIAFQHQQFQEWYASHEVIDLMRAAASGDLGALVRLRASVFDQPPWEESIYFAVERLSREPGGAAVVADAVRLALPIDPMLAAEMIYRAAPAVWENVTADIMAFVDRWHRRGTVDRAVRFMIMTGRPEFEVQIWPLASSTDQQTQLPTLRTAPRFRPAVLGADIRSKISALSETTREHLLSLIASESGVDGMDLATELAQVDPSPSVQADVVQNLQFRRADRHVAQLLSNAHDETWSLVAKRGYAEEILDPIAAKRLRQEREKALAHATEPLERLRLLLEQSPSYPDRDAGIAAAIADAKFPVMEQNGGASFHYAKERAPAAVLRGLRQRLEMGLPLPFHSDDLLGQLETTDEGPIAAAILDVSQADHRLNATAIIAGPKTVGTLVDRFVINVRALKTSRNDASLSEEYHRLRARISTTRTSSFLSALMARTDTEDPIVIGALCSLVAVHGDDEDRNVPMRLDPGDKPAMIEILSRWVDVIIESPAVERYDLNEVSNAIGRFGFSELIPALKRLLDEDLARRQAAQTRRVDALRRGDTRTGSDAVMGYGNQYRQAFVRIGGARAAEVLSAYLEDRTFGLDAALAIKAISDRQLGIVTPNAFRSWPDFAEVAPARTARAAREDTPANALAEPIFAAINRLASPEIDERGQLLAIALTWVALSMPHVNQDELVERVVLLPRPLKTKCQLFAAIALDGQVLDAEVILQAIEEWLTDAEKDAWQKRQHTWEIEPWLELLPFSTRPESVFEGLTKVKQFYGSGWAKRWERVLAAVAAAPGSEGDTLLANLARTHTDIADEYAWTKTFFGRNTASAVLLYVDLYIEGVFGQRPHTGSTWHLGRELASCIEKFPELRPELQKRYERVGPSNARVMLEYFLGEAGNEDDLIAMVQKYVAEGRSYEGRLAGAIRGAALRNVPVSETSNAYYIQPVPIPRARRYLFGLLGGNSQETALAKACLMAIDELRDDYGIAANDTRHPDVMSELPWPPEAGLS